MLQVTLLTFLAYFQISTAIIIDLPGGQIEGITGVTLAGTKYHSFLALRYAEPPIKQRRFQPPEPLNPWFGVFNATSEKTVCYQVYEDNAKESEDCLFANIHTPVDLTSSFTADRAVMVWIHGGGFISGAAYMTEGGVGPKFFMDADVVFVSINYRLGPFGFLTSGDDVIAGNMGLKDQQLALKWVQENIEYFGGDPKKVTIFGQSAGSSSVSYQLLSPQSAGLFRAAILESGSALSPFAYQRNQKDITYQLAQIIDPSFTSKDSKELLRFLQSVPSEKIDNASFVLASTSETPENYQISKGFFYAPVIEAPNDNSFLTDFQYESFEKGNYHKVPIFIGMTSEESLGLLENGGSQNEGVSKSPCISKTKRAMKTLMEFMAVSKNCDDLKWLWDAYDADPSVMVPYDLHITDASLKKEIGAEIRNFATDGKGFNNSVALGIIYHSMHDFDKSSIKQAELMSNHSTVYFYQFSYHGPMGHYTYDVPGCGKVTHAEEVNYFFSKWYSPEIPDNTNLDYFPESDRKVHYRIMALWANFAKYLNPTPPGVDEDVLQNVTWEAVKPGNFSYLDIGQDLVMTPGYPKQKKYLFWKDLYQKYAVPPLDTF